MELLQVLDMAWCKGADIAVVQNIVSTVILIIQVAVPILLIIFGMLDLGKAVVASKEDEIKKGQQTFIKRLMAAVIVFLVIFVVKIVINVIFTGKGDTDKEKQNVWNCVACFIGGDNCMNSANVK